MLRKRENNTKAKVDLILVILLIVPPPRLAYSENFDPVRFRSVCRDLCKDLFDKWSKLDDSHFSVETVSGGITNLCEYFTSNMMELGILCCFVTSFVFDTV